MGRPLNKRFFGEGEGKILATRYFFTGGSETAGSTTAAYIVNQKGSNKFTVTDGSTTEVLTLVNKANGALAAGEFTVHAVLEDSSTVQVTRFYNRKVQYEGGTANVAKVRWGAGVHPAADDAGAAVDVQ